MIHYGEVITGKKIDENEKAFFIQSDGVTFELDKTPDLVLNEDDEVSGFIYENTHHVKKMTTSIPKSQVGHYAFGTVVSMRRDLGVFVDIGLPDKDVVVSVDRLPTLTALWPNKGDQLMISLVVDEKARMWGRLADEDVFQSIARKGDNTLFNRDVTGIAYRMKLVGTYIITSDYYIGFIHPSERINEPRLGEQVKGRVIGVRSDGVLNISLKPRTFEAISDDALMILEVLKQAPAHEMPYTDKSDPESILNYFGISKGAFKRAIGHLLKGHYIKQENGNTILIKSVEEIEAQTNKNQAK